MKQEREKLPIDRNSSGIRKVIKRGIPVVAFLMSGGILYEGISNATHGNDDSSTESIGKDSMPFLSSPDPTLSPSELSSFRDSIESKFSINLSTFDEISEFPQTKAFYGIENLVFPFNQEWNEQNLDLLEQVLEDLPSSFYEPRNGEKVNIILGPSAHCGHDIKGFTPQFPREVMLPYSFFKPDKPITAGLIAIHEFGHMFTTDSCNTIGTSFIEGIEEIIGESFSDIHQDLPIRIAEVAQENELEDYENQFVRIEKIDTLEDEQVFRLSRLLYGVSDSREFIAVMFESYYLGKDYFYRMYEPFFDTDTNGLYNFVNDVFKGKEYSEYRVPQD